MGNKNNRGNVQPLRMAQIIANKKAETQRKMEEQQQKKLDAQKEQAKQLKESFDPSTIPQHDSMAVEQVGDANQLIIDLDFINKGFIVDMPSLLKTLPLYAPYIEDVKVRLYAPAKFPSRSIYKSRIEEMKQMVEILNEFNINKFKLIIGLNHEDFYQMKLAALVFGLQFQEWALKYHIFDRQGETIVKAKVTKGSGLGRRLRGVYNAEFLAQ